MAGLILGLAACGERAPQQDDAVSTTLPTVVANDNRKPAGKLRGGELTVRLVVQMARWYPQSEDGPSVDLAAFAEEGKPPQIPAPLLRVPAGTIIAATLRNALGDSTIYVLGLTTKPAAGYDSIAIAPGETRVVRFAAGAPGTYLYGASPGRLDNNVREREQLAGALVIDSANARTDDRIFVINIWGEPKDSLNYRNALAINGKSWPYTERINTVVSDSLRWRVINGSAREHPMHLHGFYFRIDARGTFKADTLYAPSQRRLAVTEDLGPGHTMSMVWSPDRPGNWLFHCHIGFHVEPAARLDPPEKGAHEWHAVDASKHMAGLILGITAQPAKRVVASARGQARTLHLFVNEGKRRGHAPRALGFVLQRDGVPPAPDSIEIPGTTLLLTRGEPTDITVVNRLHEGTAVHWHGIELESYWDGVAGWSGANKQFAPVIAPGDSFTARLTLPRAGTFMYHTHLNDLEQITSGLYGALVVLEPGRPFDPRTDHVFVAAWDGADDPPHITVNGDTTGPPIELVSGSRHRLRFVNIGPAAQLEFSLKRDTTLVTWRARAKDGADLPPQSATERPALQRLNVGETADVEFTPAARGVYTFTVGGEGSPPDYVRRFVVR